MNELYTCLDISLPTLIVTVNTFYILFSFPRPRARIYCDELGQGQKRSAGVRIVYNHGEDLKEEVSRNSLLKVAFGRSREGYSPESNDSL